MASFERRGQGLPGRATMTMDSLDSDYEEGKGDLEYIFKYIEQTDYGRLQSALQIQRRQHDVAKVFDREHGYTPLMFAAYKNSEEACKILIDFFLSEDYVHHTSRPNSTARKLALAEWLDTRSAGEEGFTALHFASFHGSMPIARLMCDHGASLNVINAQGINLLHVAAQGDQPVSIAFFTSKGLDINSVDRKRSTALHWAAYSGTDLTLNYLLAWGANLEQKDGKGMTPLHIAVR